MNHMLLYALIIWLMLTLYRVWAKMVSIDPLRASFLWALITACVAWSILLYIKPALENLYASHNLIWLALAWSVLVISWILIVKGFQKGFPVSIYSTLYTICGLILVVLYWILIDKEPITLKKMIWFILACSSVYFLLVP